MSHDVIVVGGGGAGMCAALSAREHGARVLVLERAPQDKRGGNTAFASGTFRMVHHGADDIRKVVPDLTEQEIANTDFGEYTAEQYFDDLGRITQYHIDPDLADVLIHQSADTVHWLHKLGVRFLPNYGRQAFKIDGRFKFFGGSVIYANGGGEGLMEAHFKNAERLGIDVRYGARGVALLRGATRRRRRARRGRRRAARTSAPRPWCWRAAASRPTANGARAISARAGTWRRCAAPASTPATASAWRSTSARSPTASGRAATPAPGSATPATSATVETRHNGFRHSYLYGIVVNADGKRFLDEGADFRNFTYAKYGRVILQQPGGYAWQVFDAQAKPLMRDEYKLRGATKVTADTLEDLATRMQDVDARRSSSRRCASSTPRSRATCRSIPTSRTAARTEGLEIDKTNWATALEQPPFEAYSVGCGITFTFGGLKIDNTGRVLDIEDAPLPGLYAAGELVGGIFYFNYPGATGLMSSAVFGRLAGRSAAGYAKCGLSGSRLRTIFLRRTGSALSPEWNASSASAAVLHLRIEARRVLDLIEPVEAHLLGDAVRHHDQPAFLVIAGDVLVVGERRDVDVVAALPGIRLGLGRPFPLERFEAIPFQIPVQVVARAFDHEDDLLPHVPVDARLLAGLEELHVGFDAHLAGVQLLWTRCLISPSAECSHGMSSASTTLVRSRIPCEIPATA